MANRLPGRSSAPKSKPPARKDIGRPFPKGVSGNPRGRPKRGESYSDLIREMAMLKDVRDARGALIERKRAIVEKLYSKAIRDGDPSSIKLLMDHDDPQGGGGADARTTLILMQAIILQATERHPEVRNKIIAALERAPVEGP
jgi:hypothetical protein